MAEGCLVCGRRGAQGQRPSLFNDFSVRLHALLEFYSQISLHGTMFIFKMNLSLFKKSDSFLKRQI